MKLFINYFSFMTGVNKEKQRKIVEILKILRESKGNGENSVIGARKIADALRIKGYEMSERVIRRYLSVLDAKGFTKKEGYAGRKITALGLEELKEAQIEDRLSYISQKIENLMYKTTFDPKKREGGVVINLSLLKEKDLEKALAIIRHVVENGYALSPYLKIFQEEGAIDRRIFKIPPGFVGIATLCNATIDGVLLKRGIPVEVKYSGVLEIKKDNVIIDMEAIRYNGTTIDPVKIFMERKMHAIPAMKNNRNIAFLNLRRWGSIDNGKEKERFKAKAIFKNSKW